MPVAQTNDEHGQRLVRQVVAVRGQVRFEMECSPRFDYGRAEHTVEPHEHGVLFRSDDCALALETETPLRVRDGAAQAAFSLSQGEAATFVLEHVPGDCEPHTHSAAQTRELFETTVAYWPHRVIVMRTKRRGYLLQLVHAVSPAIRLDRKLKTERPSQAEPHAT
jgi:GH15 family glucan-1,4-alpha-glucosidase